MATSARVHDPIIYPGLYSTSGFDMMNILIRVAMRPKPRIDLGPIDSSCAIIMCDLQQPDAPLVYCSDPFLFLTGYKQSEVLGRNCRFLQAPGGDVQQGAKRNFINKELLRSMRRSVETNDELQVEVTNFRKDGSSFVNLLTMIPVPWDTAEYRYSVGFLCDRDS